MKTTAQDPVLSPVPDSARFELFLHLFVRNPLPTARRRTVRLR